MEITCPHCQARHAAEAEFCPVCGTPVGGASPAALQRAGPTAPAERAGATVPMTQDAMGAMPVRRHPLALVEPWRLVLLGATGTLMLAALLALAVPRLWARAPITDPGASPTATSAPDSAPPGSASPAATPLLATPGASPAASPTPAGRPAPTATPVPTATTPPAPPTVTPTIPSPTPNNTPVGHG